MSDKSHYEITAAENKSIGFDYQYYYFLLRLLELRDGEEIGLEVKDDIHIKYSSGQTTLLQLKHTIQKSVTGTPKNLTERDVDLWKTINNWLQVIGDPVEGRGKQKNKLDFIEKTEFVLVSNKLSNTTNAFFSKLNSVKDGSLSIDNFKYYLQDLHDTTTNSSSNKELRQYILNLKSLSNKVLSSFLNKITFTLGEDDLISQIKVKVKGYMIAPEKIDDVYRSLNSNLRDMIYFNVKDRKKITFTHQEFYNKFRGCFGKIGELPIRRMAFTLPKSIEEQTFIKQLLAIGDLAATDKSLMKEYTRFKLLMYNNLELWNKKGELTEEQKKIFVANCVTQWKNLHIKHHRQNNKELLRGKTNEDIKDELNDAAQSCIDALREIKLAIEDQPLDIEISNGQFYLLSDDDLIGWQLDYQKIYK